MYLSIMILLFLNDCYSKNVRWLLFEGCTNQMNPRSNHELTLKGILVFNYFLINYYAIKLLYIPTIKENQNY